MVLLKPGARLKSVACDTQIMVVKGTGEHELHCGGSSVAAMDLSDSAEIKADFANGSQMGKRYVNDDGSIELLCTKPGEGSLSLGDTILEIKATQALPSSD